jgi:hypothetical protein
VNCNGITVSLWFVAMMYISKQEYAFHEEGLSPLLCYNVSCSRDGDLPFLTKLSSLQVQRVEEDFTPWNLAHGLLKLQVQVSGYVKEGNGCKL